MRKTSFQHDLLTLTSVTLAFAFFCASAHAQYLSGSAYQTPIMDMSGPLIAGASMQSYIKNADTAASDGASAAAAPSQARLLVSDNADISRRTQRAFRDQLVRANPKQKHAIDQAFQQDWLVGFRNEVARPNGLRHDNLADILTAYLIAAWAIVHKQQDISPTSIKTVRDQLRQSLTTNPALTNLDAAERQRIAEDLIYNTVLIMANRVEIARTRDHRLASKASRHYRDVVESAMRIDLLKLELTDAGFSDSTHK